jgi:hypothetical protein
LKDEITEAQQALFQSGTDAGVLAQQLFPGGVEIPYAGLSVSEQLKKTAAEINRGTETIYEASFSSNGIFVKADILHKGKNGWQIYEVKTSTSVKDVNINDVAIQYYVLNGSGLAVSEVFLVYINNQYVKNGAIEVEKLFTTEDLTDIVFEKQGFVESEAIRMRKMLAGGLPEIDIGSHCSDPYECDFHGYCRQHIPENSVFDLRGRGVNKYELYKQGIVRLQDVPKEMLPDHQKIQVEGTLENKNVINRDRIKEFLDMLWYPMCFFDFETIYMVAVPMFDGTQPYQPVPFQFSLHFLENKDAELKHFEYLALANSDPRRELVERLLNKIPRDACVLAYNMQYEAGILNYLKEWFPEYAERIDAMITNLRDLMIPFKNKDIYFGEMKGSYSLKAVLPALVPGLKYDGMEISDGQMASSAWMKTWNMDNPEEIDKTRKALIEYCRLDTLAMVRILEKMRKLCQ